MNRTPRMILNIRSKYADYNPAMKRIADYVLNNCESVGGMGISAIARCSSVSEASVTRFIKSLGYKNFKTFQLELVGEMNMAGSKSEIYEESAKSLQYLEYSGSIQENSRETICKSVFRSNVRILSDTLEMLQPEVMERAAEKISKARKVVIFGVGRSYLAAESFRSRLYRFDINTFCYQDSHEQVVASNLVNEQDVVIAISNFGRSSSVVEGAVRAKELGAWVLGITSAKDSPLAKTVDDVLFTAYNYENRMQAKDKHYYETSCENIAQIVLLDCLYTLVMTFEDQKRVENYFKTVEALESVRI